VKDFLKHEDKSSRAWIFSAKLVELQPDGTDKVLVEMPPMEFTVNQIAGDAKRHSGLCNHPWSLACALYGRMRELSKKSKIKVTHSGMSERRAA